MNFMSRTLPLALSLATLPAVAWACPVNQGDELLIGMFFAPFLAIPYAALAMFIITVRARAWYPERTLRRWFVGVAGAWLAGALGCVAGLLVAWGLYSVGLDNRDALGTIAWTTPLVVETAYVMALRYRARRRLDADQE